MNRTYTGLSPDLIGTTVRVDVQYKSPEDYREWSSSAGVLKVYGISTDSNIATLIFDGSSGPFNVHLTEYDFFVNGVKFEIAEQ